MKPERLTAKQEAASDALGLALQHAEPGCADDVRFIADASPEHELMEICSACPVLAECNAYAKALRPRAGFWAGRRRGRPDSGAGDAEPDEDRQPTTESEAA